MLDTAMPVGLGGVEDLFGDEVPLSIPPKTQGRHLYQRLDELRNRGCCQTVAWSRAGNIASISPDGMNLELRMLRAHPSNGVWNLSEPTTTDLVKGSVVNPLVHLEWSPTTAPDLAVFDSVGRVMIMNFPVSLNNAYVNRKWDADTVDDMNVVVGCHWLPVAPLSQYGPATKPSKSHRVYQYESSFVHAIGPHHPHMSKSALFCVTMGGLLKMYWSQNNGRIEETTMELESVCSSDELVTHASLATDKKYIIIVVTTATKKLKVIKLEIQWAGPGAVQEKTQLSQTARLNPSLVEDHLATIDWLQMVDEPSLPEFTTLQALPSIIDNGGKAGLPLIIGVRARSSGVGGFEMMQTVIDRWECAEQKSAIQTAFEQIGSRRNSVSNIQELPISTRLKRLDPITINKTVIGVQASQYGKALVFIMSDGSVEHRDRFTFEELYTTTNESRIMNLREAGWAFSEEGPCYQAAFSPTQCSMIQIGDDGKLKWSKLQHAQGDIGDSNNDGVYCASIAGLSIAAAGCVHTQANFDDLLAIAHPLADKKRFTQDWIQELIRILKIQVDYSQESHHESLMRNNSLHACMSIMNSLGFKGELAPRSFQSKFANVFLNVRIIVILTTVACNTPLQARDKVSPLDEPGKSFISYNTCLPLTHSDRIIEVVEALAGELKWSIDLLAWILDCLFELMSDETFVQHLNGKLSTAAEYLQERNDVALHVLLCSSTRSFLLAMCRRIAHLDGISFRAVEFYRKEAAEAEQSGVARLPSGQLQQAYQRMQRVTSTSLVPVGEFEKMLNTLGHDVKQAYAVYLPALLKQSSHPPQGKQIDHMVRSSQAQMEMVMLVSRQVPPAFMPLIKKFLMDDLRAMRAQTDPAQLFFADYAALGVQDDACSLAARAARGGSYYDVFKRVELRPSATLAVKPWRRCVRCPAVMEDVSSNRPGVTYVVAQQRKCSCGGSWGLLAKDKLVL
ncbi:RNA polymerase II Mediator complex subunit Sin4 [Cordyceps militaris CM01]|uniref:Mediator of RNA polymerase II transcription subunit 16 n=1 Tax=Cordyceps militaris (strain CM01) TaxID=983644 RepID=G3JNT6_CORMM|nr:RNA polymerase II Mediator complex subunit Sin4 [Cordyceps militaris CM01]EGX89926.1 RNA polymerase II Mediator complex subunit Sin4 [Cordyceps militaris CM01]